MRIDRCFNSALRAAAKKIHCKIKTTGIMMESARGGKPCGLILELFRSIAPSLFAQQFVNLGIHFRDRIVDPLQNCLAMILFIDRILFKRILGFVQMLAGFAKMLNFSRFIGQIDR